MTGLDQAVQVHAFVRGHRQRFGEGHEDLTGRGAVGPAFETGEVLDADAGAVGQLAAAQSRSAAACGVRGSGRFAAGPQEPAQSVVGHGPGS